MVQILTPNYAIGANQPSPISQGLGAFYQMQANRRAQQATQLAQRLGDLQAQKAQTELQYLPGALTTAHQQAQLNVRKQALVNQASQMAYNNTRRTLVQNRLADVAQLPQDQQAPEYQQVRKEALAQGADPNFLPADYSSPRAQALAKHALSISPQMAAQRKSQNAFLMQELKNRGLMQAVQAKQAGVMAPGAQELSKKEADANSDYKTQTIADSGSAQNILGDINNIQASLNQAFSGYTGTLANWDTAEGQLLKKNTNALVLDKLQGMKHISRGTNMLMGIIKRSKPADWMKRGAIERITAGMGAISHRAVQKESFTQFMWDHGITDRGKIDNLWNKYDADYPLIDVKADTVNTQNIGRWAEFLRNNRKLVDRMRGIKTPAAAPVAAPSPTGQVPQGIVPTQASLLGLSPQQAAGFGFGFGNQAGGGQ